MSVVSVELDLPNELDQFRLPTAVEARLQHLLDKQDEGHVLSEAERQEAEGLVDLTEMLSLLRMRMERASQSNKA